MADFERARSLEQKEARIEEIKAAAESLFNEVPYHEITLSMIADRLSWTRANLYRYFKSKEEIFLDLDRDSMNRYYDLLMSSLPEGNDYPPDMVANIWATVISNSRMYIKYGLYQNAIIEKNVCESCYLKFKKAFYARSSEFGRRLSEMYGISSAVAMELQFAVYFHAIGKLYMCSLDAETMRMLKNLENSPRFPTMDFKESIRQFTLLCLENITVYQKRCS